MGEMEDLHRAMEIADKYDLRLASPCNFRSCKLCGEPFIVRHKQRTTCSIKCKKAHYYAKNRERLKMINRENHRKRRGAVS